MRFFFVGYILRIDQMVLSISYNTVSHENKKELNSVKKNKNKKKKQTKKTNKTKQKTWAAF